MDEGMDYFGFQSVARGGAAGAVDVNGNGIFPDRSWPTAAAYLPIAIHVHAHADAVHDWMLG